MECIWRECHYKGESLSTRTLPSNYLHNSNSLLRKEGFTRLSRSPPCSLPSCSDEVQVAWQFHHIPHTTYHIPHNAYHIPHTIYHIPYITYPLSTIFPIPMIVSCVYAVRIAMYAPNTLALLRAQVKCLLLTLPLPIQSYLVLPFPIRV